MSEELKRTCQKCETIWYSSQDLERRLSSISSGIPNLIGNLIFGATHSSIAQEKHTEQSAALELARLKRCPKCGSLNYREIIEKDQLPLESTYWLRKALAQPLNDGILAVSVEYNSTGVIFRSNPDKAAIYLGSLKAYIGDTPVETKLNGGLYAFEAILSGYKSISDSFTFPNPNPAMSSPEIEIVRNESETSEIDNKTVKNNDLVNSLERLAALRLKGLLSEEEFLAAKLKLLAN